jgi:hypothetical protein
MYVPPTPRVQQGEEKDDWVVGEFLLLPLLVLTFPIPSLTFSEEM